MRVNLIGEHKKVYLVNWYRIMITVLTIILIAVLGLNYIFLIHRLGIIQNEVSNLNSQLRVLLPKKEEYLQLKEKIQVLEALRKEIQAARYYWDKVILDYGYVVPEMAKLQFLQIENKTVSLNGIAASNTEIIELIQRMQSSPFFNVVEIIQIIEKGEVNFKIKALVTGGSELE